MQTIAEKVEALRTVLPLLHVHHPPSKSCIKYERQPTGEPPPSPDPCASLDCPTCLVYQRLSDGRCPAEKWEATRRYYRIRYRTKNIEDALDVLYLHSPAAAQAVYYEYVEPWSEFNPDTRGKWSEAGLHFLAAFIRGDIPFHSLDPVHERWRYEARRLKREGLSVRQIAKRMDMGSASVQAAIHNVPIIAGRLRRSN